MARYIGPKTKVARNFGDPIFGFDKNFDKRNYPSGQHGVSKKRRVKSEFATQLREKQKAKYTYGVLERQFRRFFDIAARKSGVTGENLLKLLEARLDNTVFRLGLANSRMQARQLVGHKHIMVNGEIVNVASFILKPGDKIEVREKSKGLEVIKDAISKRGKTFSWLEFNHERMEGKILSYPERELIPENINEQLIVELYSK